MFRFVAVCVLWVLAGAALGLAALTPADPRWAAGPAVAGLLPLAALAAVETNRPPDPPLA